MRTSKYINNVWCAECSKWIKRHLLQPNQKKCSECSATLRITPVNKEDKEKNNYLEKVRY